MIVCAQDSANSISVLYFVNIYINIQVHMLVQPPSPPPSFLKCLPVIVMVQGRELTNCSKRAYTSVWIFAQPLKKVLWLPVGQLFVFNKPRRMFHFPPKQRHKQRKEQFWSGHLNKLCRVEQWNNIIFGGPFYRFFLHTLGIMWLLNTNNDTIAWETVKRKICQKVSGEGKCRSPPPPSLRLCAQNRWSLVRWLPV